MPWRKEMVTSRSDKVLIAGVCFVFLAAFVAQLPDDVILKILPFLG